MPHTRSSSIGWHRSGRPYLAALCAAGAGLLAAPAGASGGEYQPASGPSDKGGPRVYTTTNARKLFYTHRRKMRLSYRVVHPDPVTVNAKLIHPRSGDVLKRWRTTVDDDGDRYLYWDGLIGGDLQGERKYAFRIVARDQNGRATYSASESDRDRDSFKLWHNRFPVRGRHGYGDGLGAGRGHQGQDVFADCGTPLEAARGGRIQYAGYQSSAGNYVVIDGKRTKRDYVYMHLQRLPVSTGQRVRTGERIGRVGETGNASGCHLHFELWSKPGWYEGGSPLNATKFLKHWDSYS